MIWLPASHGGAHGGFPTDMPTLEAHLSRFKPLLEATVTRFGKGRLYRPWWSAHNPRTNLVEGRTATSGWADLAVTTRWGDRKLLTALAPAKALPLSGLHAVVGGGSTTAAYLVDLINSTPVQELAEALAPGSVGQGDIEELGLPLFNEATAREIRQHTRQLADTVRTLVLEHGRSWPALPNTLRADISLAGHTTAAWAPAAHRHDWGTSRTGDVGPPGRYPARGRHDRGHRTFPRSARPTPRHPLLIRARDG